MTKSLSIVLGVLIALVVVIGAVLLFTPEETTTKQAVEKADKGPIELGWIGPLTGDLVIIGLPQQTSAQIALDEINTKGGINGQKLKIIWEDGKCDPKSAATAAQKLVNVDNVKVIIGAGCSIETLAVAPITEPAKVILFSPASTSPDVTNAGDFVFRDVPSDADAGKNIAKASIDFGYEKVAVIVENNDYGLAWAGAFRETFEDLGGDILIQEKYDPDTSDYRSIILKVKNKNPNAIILVSLNPAKAGLLIKQISELEVGVPLLGTEVWAAEEILTVYPEEIEGMVIANIKLDKTQGKTKQMLDKYTAKIGEECGWPDYCTAAYDAVYILAEAIENVGYDSEKIRDYLYAVQDWQGASGKITIDENGDAIREFILNKVVDGELVQIS